MSELRPAGYPTVVVRTGLPEDCGDIAQIYAEPVLHEFGTFEHEPPSVAEMQRRQQAILDGGGRYLVAEGAAGVLGYAYASQFRPRPAYRYTVEDSVYVRKDQRGRGVGRQLLGALIESCEAAGFRQMIAIIGDSSNVGSINLHLQHGFRQIGIAEAVGFKRGRWVDIVWMQRALSSEARA